MRKFIKDKYKVLLLCMFVLFGMAACSNPRGTDGKNKADQIIASEEMVIDKDQVNISDISNEQIREELENTPGDTITIEPTSWSQAWSNGWFEGLIVWPIAQLINWFASFTDAGWGIILATLVIQLIIYAFSYKTQLAQQRMQEIQPQLERIQDKYKGKNDERSRMLMAQETQKLYNDYDIHPFGTILVTFIQLPVMMGMFYATMRAATTVIGSFMGIPLSETPLDGFRNLQWGPIVVYLLMIVMSIVSMMLPKWLKKLQDKKDGINQKKYDQPKGGMMSSTMNMTMYMTTAMISLMYISWPIAMSFYWLVSSVIRSGLSVVSHVISDKQEKEKKLNQKADPGILKNRVKK